jgi:hypothetical protein
MGGTATRQGKLVRYFDFFYCLVHDSRIPFNFLKLSDPTAFGFFLVFLITCCQSWFLFVPLILIVLAYLPRHFDPSILSITGVYLRVSCPANTHTLTHVCFYRYVHPPHVS